MKIVKVTDLGKEALQNPGKYNGFMGISIRNLFFSEEVMIEYINWCSKIFKEFIFLLMDEPDRHNLAVFKNLTKEEALNRAKAISDDLRFFYERLLRKMEIENIRVMGYEDLRKESNFPQFNRNFNKLIVRNKEFIEILYREMEHNIGYKIKQYFEEHKVDKFYEKKVKDKLVKCILEEVSPLIYLTENGYSVEIDPHKELVNKKMLYNGEFSSILEKVKITQRGHIFAYPKEFKY